MAPLPNRYDDAIDHDALVSDNFLVTVSIISGIGGLVIMGLALSLKLNPFFLFSMFVLEAMEITQFMQFGVFTTMIAGAVIFSASMLGGWAALRNNRSIMILFLVFLGLFSVIELVAGAFVLNMINLVNAAVYASSDIQGDNGGPTDQLIDLQLVMYNECCWAAGHSNDIQQRVLKCDAQGQAVQIDPEDPYTQLAGCFRDEEIYFSYQQPVAQNREFVCNLLEEATVNIDGVSVPGQSIKVERFTEGVLILPLVGNYTVEEGIFGCGIGYAKPFQAAIFLWFEQSTKPLAISAVIAAVAQLLAMMFGISALSFGSEAKESASDAYSRYMTQVRQSTRIGPASPPINQNSYQMAPHNNQPGARISMRSNTTPQGTPIRGKQQHHHHHQQHITPPSSDFNVDDKI